MGLNTTYKATLKAGKYPISVISFREVSNDQGGYTEVTFGLPDRIIKQAYFGDRMVDGKQKNGNESYMARALKAQCGMDDVECSLLDILNKAKETTTLFGVVSYSSEYGMNLAFHEKVTPASVTKTDGAVGFEDAI